MTLRCVNSRNAQIKTSRGFLEDQTQERNAGETQIGTRVYPSVVLRFYKHRREDDATQRIIQRRIVNRPLVYSLIVV